MAEDKPTESEEEAIEIEEEEDVIERTKIILNQSIELFNRLGSDISTFKSRVFTFFGIVIGISSLQLALIKFVTDNGYHFSGLSNILLIAFIVFIMYSLIVLVRLCRSNEYRDVDIFKENRFDELATFNKSELLSDFLFQYKESYNFNINQYSDDVILFGKGYNSFVIGLVIYAILILALVMHWSLMINGSLRIHWSLVYWSLMIIPWPLVV